MKIAFVHPDLGIGRAGRLVVDAAVGLQKNGHSVTIYTSHCDKSHCFDEVASGELDVRVCGDFLPIAILGKLHILCAILRQLNLAACLIASGHIQHYDYFIVDQLSFCVPLLSVFGRGKVLFYCHFPDLLLARKSSWAKRLYRMPFDAVEEWTTGTSDNVVVNSRFTRSVFRDTFPSLRAIEPGVVYPCVDLDASTDGVVETENRAAAEELLAFTVRPFLLSINRFERLKNIELAIEAYAQALPNIDADAQPLLLVAGGYDVRVHENVEYLQELETLCDRLGLVHYTFRSKLVTRPTSTQVVFLPLVRGPIKNAALRHAELLLYTPTFEHFGIVPVESMLHHTPVLAVNRGGPLETVVSYDGSNAAAATGYTRANDVAQWAHVIKSHLVDLDSNVKTQMGANGHARVKELFSRERMTQAFETQLAACRTSTRDKGLLYRMLQLWMVWMGIGVLAVTAVLLKTAA